MSQFGITEYPNTFKRQGSFPLDKSSKFKSLADAIDYAESSKIAYEGQIISVVENDNVNVYLLKRKDDADSGFKLVIIPTISTDVGDFIIDMNKLINSKVGIWTISKNSKGNVILDFDIWHAANADSYEVSIDDITLDKKLLGEDCIVDLKNIHDDSIINLTFYNNGVKSFEVNAKPIYKNEISMFGSLHLIKSYEEELV